MVAFELNLVYPHDISKPKCVMGIRELAAAGVR